MFHRRHSESLLWLSQKIQHRSTGSASCSQSHRCFLLFEAFVLLIEASLRWGQRSDNNTDKHTRPQVPFLTHTPLSSPGEEGCNCVRASFIHSLKSLQLSPTAFVQHQLSDNTSSARIHCRTVDLDFISYQITWTLTVLNNELDKSDRGLCLFNTAARSQQKLLQVILFWNVFTYCNLLSSTDCLQHIFVFLCEKSKLPLVLD